MAYNFSNISVLLINDAASSRKTMAMALKLNQVKDVYEAMEYSQAMRLFKEHKPDVIITEMNIGHRDANWMTHEIRHGGVNDEAPVILISGNANAMSLPDVRDAGINEILIAPYSVDSIAERLAYTLNHPRDFIRSESYIGPDRRRKDYDSYEGPFRREDDDPDKKLLLVDEAIIGPTESEMEAEAVLAEWPEQEQAEEMLDTLFDHYIKHHEIVLRKLRLAKEASSQTENADATDSNTDALWNSVMGMVSKSGLSEDEMKSIENTIHRMPKDVREKFESLREQDKKLTELEKQIDTEAFEKANKAADELQSKSNPLSCMTKEDYEPLKNMEEDAKNDEKDQKQYKVEVFNFVGMTE